VSHGQTTLSFRENSVRALGDDALRAAMKQAADTFGTRRADAFAPVTDVEALRDRASAIREEVLKDLPGYVERFAASAARAGATVHRAKNATAAREIIARILSDRGAKRIVKGKSMVSEESALDLAIEGAGLEVVETDLGEYILQINGYEPPSHLVGPALHKSKEEVAELFHKAHGTPLKSGIEELCLEARGVLRQHYLTADMGISGGNFFVAESGSVVLVTNEGNATLTTTPPFLWPSST